MNYLDMLNECTLCNRNCKINRNNKQFGFCRASDKVKIARAALHFGEEPPISQGNGSGTVFFSHCNFNCVFCQNHTISQGNIKDLEDSVTGIEVSIERLSEIFLELQKKGANNINLVTPTHYVPQIIEALKIAKNNDLTIPVLYNTNGYDSLETIKALDGYIDVYLPDFKYFNDKYAIKYSKVSNYASNTMKIITEMFNQVGKPKFDLKGNIVNGVIIRHLMLPGLLFDSKKVIDHIYNEYGNNVYLSLMNQYVPMFKACDYPEINKSLNPKHYESLINYALDLGIENGFVQDSGTDNIAYIPDFNLEGVSK
ncbi:radical SAM protein [Clostridium sp. C2-6-12]|uniref:radical SAM protein n=1 Tax=Clostridium sp. C2-6-12 TaxID=2698832 RepID=UPI00136BB0EA|nr:radical SAM protein [Clostridium sp. C2-6-12]